MTPSVCIVIPVYKPVPSAEELTSLRQCGKMLGHYPCAFVCPDQLAVEAYKDIMPQAETVRFEDSFFAGIKGYNRLMLSECFYASFKEFDYILIYQLDAYVFADQLTDWLRRGYDYIGAPWVQKSKYHKAPYRQFFLLKKAAHHLLGIRKHQTLTADRVGNGGFSLRKVSAHIGSLRSKARLAQEYIDRCEESTTFNEDIFWSLENPQFRIPDYREAMLFSVDSRPRQCLDQISPRMPFGCHGWTRSYTADFWRQHIQPQQS